MTLRPFQTISKYKQLVAALHTTIEQLKAITALQQEIIMAHERRIEAQAATITMLQRRTTEQPVETKMPLPDVSAVEGLVGAFFNQESVTIAREAVELTRNLTPVGPQDVKATNLCLMKLWRHYAMKKLEQAAKKDAL
jgi:hypothetical protein